MTILRQSYGAPLASLEKLPNEILLAIHDYLTLPERINISLVSSELYSAYFQHLQIRLNVIFPGLFTSINHPLALSQPKAQQCHPFNTYLYFLRQLNFLHQSFDAPPLFTVKQSDPDKPTPTNEWSPSLLLEALKSRSKAKMKMLQNNCQNYFGLQLISENPSFSDKYNLIVTLANYRVGNLSATQVARQLNSFFQTRNSEAVITAENVSARFQNPCDSEIEKKAKYVDLFSLLAFLVRSETALTWDNFDLVLNARKDAYTQNIPFSFSNIENTAKLRKIITVYKNHGNLKNIDFAHFIGTYPYTKKVLTTSGGVQSLVDLYNSLKDTDSLRLFFASTLWLKVALDHKKTLQASISTITALFTHITTSEATQLCYSRILAGKKLLTHHESPLWHFLLNFIDNDAVLTSFINLPLGHSQLNQQLHFFTTYAKQIKALNKTSLDCLSHNLEKTRTSIHLQYKSSAMRGFSRDALRLPLLQNQQIPDHLIEILASKKLTFKKICIKTTRQHLSLDAIAQFVIIALCLGKTHKKTTIDEADLFDNSLKNSPSTYFNVALTFGINNIELVHRSGPAFFQYLESIKFLQFDDKKATALIKAYKDFEEQNKPTLEQFFTPRHYQKLSEQNIVLSNAYFSLFKNIQKITGAYAIAFPQSPTLSLDRIQILAITLYRSSQYNETSTPRSYRNTPRAMFITRFFTIITKLSKHPERLVSLFTALRAQNIQNTVAIVTQPLSLRSIINAFPHNQDSDSDSDSETDDSQNTNLKLPKPSSKRKRTKHQVRITSFFVIQPRKNKQRTQHQTNNDASSYSSSKRI